jgi:hypothetical protein
VAVERSDHPHLGRVPRDRAAPASWQLREVALEVFDELALKPPAPVSEPFG